MTTDEDLEHLAFKLREHSEWSKRLHAWKDLSEERRDTWRRFAKHARMEVLALESPQVRVYAGGVCIWKGYLKYIPRSGDDMVITELGDREMVDTVIVDMLTGDVALELHENRAGVYREIDP